ncbi:MAG: cyclic nucleotide-binding domain-containing protein [bacterium]|nr:cyclic nucleotide-binding domain-containing protein [bacterium]
MGTKQEMLGHPFMVGLAPEHQAAMVECAREAFIQKGTWLLRNGDLADQFFLVQEGVLSIELYVPNRAEHSIQTVHPGELLGWDWMVPPYRWTFDVRAQEDCRAFAVDARCIRGKGQVDHEFGYQLQNRISQVMARRVKALRFQLLDVYSHEP